MEEVKCFNDIISGAFGYKPNYTDFLNVIGCIDCNNPTKEEIDRAKEALNKAIFV